MWERGVIMFIAVYEFKIKDGTEHEFRESWLEVTKAIYKNCGSFGSRLHTTEHPNILVGYAQWPSREQWEKDHQLTDQLYLVSREKMRNCLVDSKTVYKLDVTDDYLQASQAQA
jgi:quinol monooxygenase YgiN